MKKFKSLNLEKTRNSKKKFNGTVNLSENIIFSFLIRYKFMTK